MATNYRKKRARRNQLPRDYADLHMHSTLSDGAFSPHALIDFAKQKNLKAISITDHDNFESINVVAAYAAENGVDLISGTELTAVMDAQDIHILAYFFDHTNLPLNMAIQEQLKIRQSRTRAILKKLQTHGIDISYERVVKNANGGVLGRPHIAQAMVQEEYVSNFSEAFSKYLGDNGAAFVERRGHNPEQIITIIKNAGGVPVLAHPYASKCDDIIPHLKEVGLVGIETYSHLQKGPINRKYKEIATKYDLVESGGSDFHSFESGCDIGSLKMPYEVVENLKDRLDRDKAEWF
ncbi:MAG: PHP domain-containing protein [Fibrobacterales bacterium]